MVKKKFLVFCLVAALFAGSGSVYANPVEPVMDAGVTTSTVSALGVPAKVVGSHEFKCVIGQVTVEQLANFLKTFKVVDSEGNDLNMSDQLIFFDAKHKAIPLEKIASNLNSAKAYNYDLMIGMEDWHVAGTYASMVEDKDSGAAKPATGNVVYATHVQDFGWQDKVTDGKISGTEGKSKRLESITIESGIAGVGIEYTTHVQDIGWQDYVADGKKAGTEGRCLRLEGIKIRLTGDEASKYDVYYRVHAENFGWLGWASNDAPAGTAGYSYRLEGIEIKIVEKGAIMDVGGEAFHDANAVTQ